MKKIFTLALVLCISIISNAQEFVLWDFTGDVTTPSLGSGSLALIGGTTNTFAGGISGGRAFNTATYPAANANNETAGVRYNVSTVGRTGIILFWSQRHSNTSSRFTKLQISTDGTTFQTVDLTPTNTTGSTGNFDFTNDILEATAGDTWFARRVDLTGVTGVENNANFAFRIVSSFGTGTSYVAASITGSYSTSGTIRFDDVAVGANSILPITLTNFSAAANNNKAVLNWSTSTEVNFSHFNVQKSIDGTAFSTIGKVVGKNSASGATYSFEDAQLKSTQYFRLQHIDKDGSFSYSNIVRVDASLASTALQAYPNPIGSKFVLNHTAATNAFVQIISIEGKLLNRYSIANNSIQTTIDASSLQKGNYIIQFVNNGKQQQLLVTK